MPWDRGAELRESIPEAAIRVPQHFPDDPVVRRDIRDYYAEVRQFDRECGELLTALDRAGERDRTLVAMTGDNGWHMPRGRPTAMTSA